MNPYTKVELFVAILVGLMTLRFLWRRWLDRTGRSHWLNQRVSTVVVAIASACFTISAVTGFVWGHDKGMPAFSGLMAIVMGVMAFDQYRQNRRREAGTSKGDEDE